ncbi:MAG: hypothetical protein V8Q27_08170 [Eubacteriales bacterium]
MRGAGDRNISRDTVAQGDREAIILGDGSIFAEDTTITEDRVFEVDQAIKILPERGTFIVGIRPKTKLGKIGIRIRWYALKPEDLEQRVYNGRSRRAALCCSRIRLYWLPRAAPISSRYSSICRKRH